MGFFTIFQVKKVPKWVVHDVHVPVDVPRNEEGSAGTRNHREDSAGAGAELMTLQGMILRD